VEAGPGAGRRQLHRDEARRTDPGRDPGADAELIADLLPPGVLNIVNGLGAEAGNALARSNRIAKIAFTGSTATGRKIMEAATVNLIPVTLELGGKSPNIFFSDVMAQDDAFLDKAVEGFVLFAFNQGEVCTCPSRALIQEDIYEEFIERCIARVKAIKQGDPRDMTRWSARRRPRAARQDPVLSADRPRRRRRRCWSAAMPRASTATWRNGFYIQPTILKGHNKMRVFQEEIFGPVVSVTTFKDEAEALQIANDTMYGLGAGVWTATAPAPTALAARSGRAGSGSTTTTPIRPMRPLAATSSRASGARRTR
jgi:aldehyde dehydrogenase